MIRTSLEHVWHSSPNFSDRRGAGVVDILLLHYTGTTSAANARTWLCYDGSEVSSHYLVDEEGVITQMVCESKRAWHAGKSYWQGNDDINSCSVGIEIQNEGHPAGLPDFPDAQIRAVIALSKDIIARHNIAARRVLAHSDIAIGRKVDPGEKFPWQRLAEHGVGIWADGTKATLKGVPDAVKVQGLLDRIGYKIEKTGSFGENTTAVIKAFQRHYRPVRVDGMIDAETMAAMQEIADNDRV